MQHLEAIATVELLKIHQVPNLSTHGLDQCLTTIRTTSQAEPQINYSCCQNKTEILKHTQATEIKVYLKLKSVKNEVPYNIIFPL